MEGFNLYDPNYQGEVMFMCMQCGRAIYTTERYYDMNDDLVCEDCIKEYLRLHHEREGEDGVI